jgi:hypothetical protein
VERVLFLSAAEACKSTGKPRSAEKTDSTKKAANKSVPKSKITEEFIFFIERLEIS